MLICSCIRERPLYNLSQLVLHLFLTEVDLLKLSALLGLDADENSLHRGLLLPTLDLLQELLQFVVQVLAATRIK